MAIDERRRLELADAAKRTFGDDAGVTLMELLPPVGWADIATKSDLRHLERRFDGLELRFDGLESRFDRKLEALEARMDLKLETLEHKLMSALRTEIVAQTWRLVTASVATFGAFTAVVAVIVRL